METLEIKLTRKTTGKIWLSSPHMGGKEEAFVSEAFATNWIAPLGPNVNGLEENLANYLGGGVSVAALSSGTAAIHLGLILLGIEAGDEVICQSMTFSASANPIVYMGANPVFIDSEEATWNMNPLLLEKAITEGIAAGKKPKAIIVVHLYGMPAQMEQICSIANKYGIPVLEDAAEALGSSINGQKCGTFGDIAVLSFNGNKIITTSGGGALISKNKALVEKAKFLATQARDNAPHYEHSHIGYNYRMSNICAGIGRGQMLVLEERVKQRRSVYQFYYDLFSSNPAIAFLPELTGFKSNRWLTTVIIDPAVSSNGITREELRMALERENIESRPLWKPMHLQPVFKGCKNYTNGTSEHLFDHGLCLPSGSNLTKEQLSDIRTIIEKVMS
ncbi:aminotransferase class I/II-fold pyridoxal phosphate-dependent enzyme [Chitinophagaceae bacterium LB-8]|uniref:GDP-perosamine synthase n=1 Tax=Paraflavisolibacter caeni TaxID=2982496 RepID=A0A9X3BGW0_9BACT|nr:aminotransferase class I/II-fold pyridoxal phosphate-dependent enzyme [Paraflavisolibacter caeni]MCU7548482.1 aminotransferase class I/II-fold pyridoxal phosphate-dependent enzyme [Paraflavisolibacter caeni]